MKQFRIDNAGKEAAPSSSATRLCIAPLLDVKLLLQQTFQDGFPIKDVAIRPQPLATQLICIYIYIYISIYLSIYLSIYISFFRQGYRQGLPLSISLSLSRV